MMESYQLTQSDNKAPEISSSSEPRPKAHPKQKGLSKGRALPVEVRKFFHPTKDSLTSFMTRFRLHLMSRSVEGGLLWTLGSKVPRIRRCHPR